MGICDRGATPPGGIPRLECIAYFSHRRREAEPSFDEERGHDAGRDGWALPVGEDKDVDLIRAGLIAPEAERYGEPFTPHVDIVMREAKFS